MDAHTTQGYGLIFDQGYYLPNPHTPGTEAAKNLELDSKMQKESDFLYENLSPREENNKGPSSQENDQRPLENPFKKGSKEYNTFNWAVKKGIKNPIKVNSKGKYLLFTGYYKKSGEPRYQKVSIDGEPKGQKQKTLFYIGSASPVIRDKGGKEKYLHSVNANGKLVYDNTKETNSEVRAEQIKSAEELVAKGWVYIEKTKKSQGSQKVNTKGPSGNKGKRSRGKRNPLTGSLPKVASVRQPKDPSKKRFLNEFDFKITPAHDGHFYGLSVEFIASPKFLVTREWKALREKFLKRHENPKCTHCGNKKNLNCDHVLPRRKYPQLALEMGNLQLLCGRCNEDKGNRTMDFRQFVCYIEL